MDFFVSDPSEIEISGDFYHPLPEWMFKKDPSFKSSVHGHPMATLDMLYTIKLSHSAWDLRNGSWFKHMDDLAALGTNAKVDEELYPDPLRDLGGALARRRWT